MTVRTSGISWCVAVDGHLETAVQTCCVSTFNWCFFTATFSDRFIHVTGLSWDKNQNPPTAELWYKALEPQPPLPSCSYYPSHSLLS